MKIEIYGISKEIIEIYKEEKPFFDILFSEELDSIEEAEEICFEQERYLESVKIAVMSKC